MCLLHTCCLDASTCFLFLQDDTDHHLRNSDLPNLRSAIDVDVVNRTQVLEVAVRFNYCQFEEIHCLLKAELVRSDTSSCEMEELQLGRPRAYALRSRYYFCFMLVYLFF